MESKEKVNTIGDLGQMSLLTPQQLQEKSQNGELVVGCNFTEEENAKINNLAKKIDITDRAGLITYGAGAQDKLTKFSNDRLSQTSTSKLEEAGKALTDLIVILKTYNPALEKHPSANPFVRFFQQKKQDVAETMVEAKAKLDSVTKNLDEAERILKEEHFDNLVSRVKDFDEMYALVQDIYHELSMYIAAGQQSLDYAKTVQLPELDRKAKESGMNYDAQALRDFADAINSFEGNLYCLESSRQLCIFNAAFIRQLQKKYLDTATQIRQFTSQATPHWRIQMNLSLSAHDLDSAQHALDAARDFTSNLFLTTAEQLRELSIKTTLNANKPIVPIEVSLKVNDIYIDTLNRELEAYRQNMAEVREGRRINYEMEEKRNQAMRDYAIESARIAVENAYINIDPSDPNSVGEIEPDGMREATGQEPYYKAEPIENPQEKKYTL